MSAQVPAAGPVPFLQEAGIAHVAAMPTASLLLRVLCVVLPAWHPAPCLDVPQEAGMLAVRKNRYVILPKDFEKAYKNVVRKQSDSFEFYK